MLLSEFYAAVGGNYDEALRRVMKKETLLKRLVKMFPGDPSMNELEEGIAKLDAEKAFRAVHTLKGVALNLGIAELGQAASVLTELLRPRVLNNYEEAYVTLQENYAKVIGLIKEIE